MGLRWATWVSKSVLISNSDSFRAAWKFYYAKTDAVFFCIDCIDIAYFSLHLPLEGSDTGRMEEALSVLKEVLATSDLRHATVCVLAHKQDIQGSCSAEQLKVVCPGCVRQLL